MKVEKSVIQLMINHARQHSPIEACGYLAGDGDIVTHAVPLRNTDESEEHYSLDPKEQFETVRDLRKQNLKVMAVYHSHPRLAYDPNIGYVIVSLDGSTSIKLFRVKNSVVEEEDLATI
jgi:proteasome lid subunit RPN8/RPN11